MKRIIAILLLMICLVTLLGCSSQENSGNPSGQNSDDVNLMEGQTDAADAGDKIRLCLDILPLHIDEEIANDIVKQERAAENFLDAVQKNGGPTNVIAEILPADLAERETAVTRIRTEIMSGGGPDVFILGPVEAGQGQPIFNYPNIAIENRYFLPLDSYINNAQFMDWDKQLPVIMEAGKNAEGQQLLPLAYTFPITVFRKSDFDIDLPADTTWDDLLTSEYLELQAAAQTRGNGTMYEREHSVFRGLLGKIADYSTGKLMFTEEELVETVETANELREKKNGGGFDDLPDYYRTNLYVNFGDVNWQIDDEYHPEEHIETPIENDEAITIIPCYSRRGGVTAFISGFAGINRNTDHPEDAFYLLDFLLSTEQQSTSEIYRLICSKMYGVPVNTEWLSSGNPILGWSLTSDNCDELQKVIHQVSAVEFRSSASVIIGQCEALKRISDEQGGDWKEEVRKNYQMISQELQE